MECNLPMQALSIVAPAPVTKVFVLTVTTFTCSQYSG